MKRLSGRPAESRKPLTKFYGITASESELFPLKTDRSTRTPRTTSNGGLSLPCSNSALINSHTPKLNNRRIERHTKTGNQEKVSCFFAPIFGILKNRQYYTVQRGTERNSLSRLANPQAVRGGRARRNFHKFPPIPACAVL